MADVEGMAAETAEIGAGAVYVPELKTAPLSGRTHAAQPLDLGLMGMQWRQTLQRAFRCLWMLCRAQQFRI
jgi:adenylosuccinate lyase